MDDGWDCPLAKAQPTCDEILSWMTEIWLKIQLVSDSNCNIVNF